MNSIFFVIVVTLAKQVKVAWPFLLRIDRQEAKRLPLLTYCDRRLKTGGVVIDWRRRRLLESRFSGAIVAAVHLDKFHSVIAKFFFGRKVVEK